MWFCSTSLPLATIMSVIIILPSSDGHALGGGSNGFGCCMTPCPLKVPTCECPCRLPLLPQSPLMLPQSLPLFPPLPTFPQFPAYPNGAYAVPDNSNVRQQMVENGYSQQPYTYKTLPSISNQQRPSYQNAGAYGYSVNQLEQPTGSVSTGYATGSYGLGNGNFGDYSSAYSLPQSGLNENRFSALPQQVPVSGAGQYMSGPLSHALQSDTPLAVTADTAGTEYNSSPTAGDYEKKTKAFLKMRKSQLA
ncbi:high molecular weight glutenin subunit X [Loa loa]|uniref:High molecular weight glutenin subunit X n=2 Tax=Loa loa TaxID=7209 RepID=A0A1S0UBA3_LOALO|nr:high molecular weight glutenin subunit X [Loa loa]EFO28105.1 high molecular weight glutenin subunit X [Loa loa]